MKFVKCEMLQDNSWIKLNFTTPLSYHGQLQFMSDEEWGYYFCFDSPTIFRIIRVSHKEFK